MQRFAKQPSCESNRICAVARSRTPETHRVPTNGERAGGCVSGTCSSRTRAAHTKRIWRCMIGRRPCANRCAPILCTGVGRPPAGGPGGRLPARCFLKRRLERFLALWANTRMHATESISVPSLAAPSRGVRGPGCGRWEPRAPISRRMIPRSSHPDQ